jgi:acyl-coenzyme A thioesterase PaaI-like protein
MTMKNIMLEARASGNFQMAIDSVPYAKMIGMSCFALGDELIFKLAASERNIGNPLLPAIHGGVLGGFMEAAAGFHIAFQSDIDQLPKIVDFSLDYLRSAKVVDTFARCDVIRQGKRVVNVQVTAWQSSPDLPITTARAHFLLPNV